MRVTVIATGFEKTPFNNAHPAAEAAPSRVDVAQNAAPAANAQPVQQPASDGPEVPAFVNEPRYVMPRREDARRTSLYAERTSFEPSGRTYQPADQEQPSEREERDSFYSEDPFENEDSGKKASTSRRGFSPDIPPFLRGRHGK